jgi:hypothetical protein
MRVKDKIVFLSGIKDKAIRINEFNLITVDGTDIVDVDADFQWRTKPSVSTAIGIAYRSGVSGAYTYEIDSPFGGSISGVGYASAEHAIESARSFLAIQQAEFDAIQASPELRLEHELEQHDWFYQYSDDGSVWQQGVRHGALIMSLMKQVDESKAVELWNKYAPEDMKKAVSTSA